MRVRGRRFEVDRSEGKLLGVCAGIANVTGIDATIVRVVVVLLAITTSIFWTLVAYLVAGMIGHVRRHSGHSHQAQSRIGNAEEARGRMRSLDLRMQAIETYATSANSRLAREIEDLR